MAKRVDQDPPGGERSKKPNGRIGIAGLINAMFLGMVSVYTATRSIDVTIVAGLVVGALAGIYIVINRRLMG